MMISCAGYGHIVEAQTHNSKQNGENKAIALSRQTQLSGRSLSGIDSGQSILYGLIHKIQHTIRCSIDLRDQTGVIAFACRLQNDRITIAVILCRQRKRKYWLFFVCLKMKSKPLAYHKHQARACEKEANEKRKNGERV